MPYTFTYLSGSSNTILTGMTYTGGSTEAILESTVVHIKFGASPPTPPRPTD
jgi:hypothetical protein